jgi:hypothetical protein
MYRLHCWSALSLMYVQSIEPGISFSMFTWYYV